MKKQLLLCACVAIKSLLASDSEDNQQKGVANMQALPNELLEMIAGRLSLRDLINLSQTNKRYYDIVTNVRMGDIDTKRDGFFAGSNIDARIIEILQKCSAVSPMNAFETISILVNNAAILLSDEYSNLRNNPSLEFIITGLKLCQGVPAQDKSVIIKLLADASDTDYARFTSTAKTLCEGVNDLDKISTIIIAILAFPAESLTDTLLNALKTICTQIQHNGWKTNIIKALANVPADKYELFIETAVSLCNRSTCGYRTNEIIKALANVPADKLTDGFISAAKKLCEGITDEYDSVNIIQALANLPAEQLTEAFISSAEKLCGGITNGYTRAIILKALANVPTENHEACANAVMQANPNNFHDIINIIERFKAR